uniref:Uncharacterized protein n=1 Tax=Meloidogyne incognita TaxID=6306 RepID=A0A914M702_MELIC
MCVSSVGLRALISSSSSTAVTKRCEVMRLRYWAYLILPLPEKRASIFSLFSQLSMALSISSTSLVTAMLGGARARIRASGSRSRMAAIIEAAV